MESVHLGLRAREFGLVSARHPEVTLPWATFCEYLDLCLQGLVASLNSRLSLCESRPVGMNSQGRFPLPDLRESPGQDRKFS